MHNTVAAVSIRRRTMALALFRDLHLQGAIVRHIPNDAQKAENTILGFAHEICSRFRISSVAIEDADRPTERGQKSYECARRAFVEESVALHEVPRRDLLESYGYGRVTQRQQVRRIAKRIWPSLDTSRYGIAALDAAIIGLYMQTKRLLDINPNES